MQNVKLKLSKKLPPCLCLLESSIHGCGRIHDLAHSFSFLPCFSRLQYPSLLLPDQPGLLYVSHLPLCIPILVPFVCAISSSILCASSPLCPLLLALVFELRKMLVLTVFWLCSFDHTWCWKVSTINFLVRAVDDVKLLGQGRGYTTMYMGCNGPTTASTRWGVMQCIHECHRRLGWHICKNKKKTK